MPNKDVRTQLTDLTEFSALRAHHMRLKDAHMRDLFADDTDRDRRFTRTLDGLTADYSKHLLDQEAFDALCALAGVCGVAQARDAMFAGQPVNTTENRAALHTALRDPSGTALKIGGEAIAPFILETREQIRRIAEDMRKNPDVRDVVHIGIGGSDLGPRMVHRALSHMAGGPRVHFVANVDPADLIQTLKNLEPRTTRIAIASKTFTTLETMENAKLALQWLEAGLGKGAAATHMLAITMNSQGARSFGIAPNNILPLRDWIGGRYSVWSAIGLPIAIAYGYPAYASLLAGAHVMDRHFKSAPLAENIPVILALLGIWYRNFWDFRSAAVLPYVENLNLLPAYVQQLDMESNGKAAIHATGPVIFGASGTNGQHAFYQLLHQGTDIIPCDFIISITAHYAHQRQHNLLLANALAQSQALMQGRVNKAEPHRDFPGNRPSTIIGLKALDAHHIGMLLALYEHKIFVQGVIWNINSFDQWGVELGKTLAAPLAETLETGKPAPEGTDSSTKTWLERLAQQNSIKNS